MLADNRRKFLLKQQQRKKAILNWMSNQPATEKQLKYLNTLGYQGQAPQNKAEACKLIDKILVKKGWSKSEWTEPEQDDYEEELGSCEMCGEELNQDNVSLLSDCYCCNCNYERD